MGNWPANAAQRYFQNDGVTGPPRRKANARAYSELRFWRSSRNPAQQPSRSHRGKDRHSRVCRSTVGLCGSIQTKRIIPPQLGQPGRSDAAGTEIVGDALIGSPKKNPGRHGGRPGGRRGSRGNRNWDNQNRLVRRAYDSFPTGGESGNKPPDQFGICPASV